MCLKPSSLSSTGFDFLFALARFLTFFFLTRFFFFFLLGFLAAGITSASPLLNVSRLRVARAPMYAARENKLVYVQKRERATIKCAKKAKAVSILAPSSHTDPLG